MKLKHIVAAGLLAAAASSANAAIDIDAGTAFGTGDGSGELFVSVFRNVSGSEQSFLIDSGITATQLLRGEVADNTILGNVGGFFSTAPTSSFVFNAGAVANNENGSVGGELGGIFTSNNESAVQSFANGADFTSLSAISQQLALFGGSANAGSTDFANNQDYGPIAPGQGGYHAQLAWGSNMGQAVSFSTEGTLDSALALWAVVYNTDFSAITRVALGFLTAESGTGNIVYNTSSTPQVPLPAAVWLLGSALIGMSAIRRRRNGAAPVAA